jgi:hypothetical protein
LLVNGEIDRSPHHPSAALRTAAAAARRVKELRQNLTQQEEMFQARPWAAGGRKNLVLLWKMLVSYGLNIKHGVLTVNNCETFGFKHEPW